MKLRPGYTLLISMVVLTVLAGLGFVVPFALEGTVVLGGILMAVTIWEALALGKESGSLSLERTVPSVVGRGKIFRAMLTVHNNAGRTCFVTIRDQVPEASDERVFLTSSKLPPGTTVIEYCLRIPQRGLHPFGKTWIRITGKLGLLELTRSVDTDYKIRVLPESLVPDDELAKDALDERRLLDQVRDTRQRGEGTEFESLSEYREGDDVRRIDWRSSARMRRLIVRRFQLEQHRDVVVLVDAGRLMGTAADGGTKLDSAVDGALRIARVALQTGDRCGLGVFDNRVRGYLSPVAGVASHRVLIDHLYDIKPSWVETNFGQMFATLQSRQQKRALLIIISDLMEAETTERYRAALMALAHRHEILFVALRTPLLMKTVQAEISTPEDAARKAFAFRLMREREQTLHVLRRAGIEVLDVEPRDLTIPLINAFLKLRERSAA